MDTLIGSVFLVAIAWYAWRRFLGQWVKGLATTRRLKARVQAMQIPDEAYYEMAATELEQGTVRKGLWVKAVAETGGNDAAARARYLKLRVEAMRGEAAAALTRASERHVSPEPVSSAAAEPAESAVIHCPKCDGRLRIPVNRLLDITCPHCRQEFRSTARSS